MGRRQACLRVKSKGQSWPSCRDRVAAREVGSSLGCMRARAILVAEKSVFRKIGLSQSKQARHGEEVMLVFNCKNRSRRAGVQISWGDDGGARGIADEGAKWCECDFKPGQ